MTRGSYCSHPLMIWTELTERS